MVDPPSPDEPGPGVGLEPDDPPVPVDPTAADEEHRAREIRDPLPQPLVSVRRLVIAALLLVAVGCLVVAGRSGGDTDRRTDAQPAIASFTPAPGGRVIRQSTVGVILEQGYDGRLTINGTAIPEAQMEGAVVPGTDAYERLTEDQRRLGPRPNNRERVLFRPGPGQAITELDTGEVQITVRYWRVADGEQTARTFSYSIYTV
ncbi:MAG TPA: hypothetical protein VEW93_02125 [Acidimicrobiales bacterium]|nr:hypothetical protein [Acidimicrobiales bacterium]